MGFSLLVNLMVLLGDGHLLWSVGLELVVPFGLGLSLIYEHTKTGGGWLLDPIWIRV